MFFQSLANKLYGLTYAAYVVLPLLLFGIATLLFGVAIQLPFGCRARLTFSILHIACVILALSVESVPLVPFRDMFVPFALLGTLHTVWLLWREKRTVSPAASFSFAQQMQATFRLWGDVRRRCLSKSCMTSLDQIKDSRSRRVRFAVARGLHAAALLFTHHFAYHSISQRLFRQLHLTPRDFDMAKQTLLPQLPMIRRDLFLRTYMSFAWIWITYFKLSVAHDILSIIFVWILQWDQPSEWPPLFGSIADAYSLGRFWGVFWHRLHTATLDAYLPAWRATSSPPQLQPPPDHHDDGKAPQQEFSARNLAMTPPLQKALRALGVFTQSAIIHSVTNWIVTGRSNMTMELRFFLSNFVVCFLEVALKRQLRGVGELPKKTRQDKTETIGTWNIWTAMLRRAAGYIWVMCVLFCLASPWRTSILWIHAR